MGAQSSPASASAASGMRCRGSVLCRILACSGKKYCGVVTTRSQSSSGAQGRPICTSRARPPDCWLNPARHRLITAPGTDHQIGPGCLQGAGLCPVNTRQGDAQAQVRQQFPGTRQNMLLLIAQTQLFSQRQHLRIITGFPAQQTPNLIFAPQTLTFFAPKIAKASRL